MRVVALLACILACPLVQACRLSGLSSPFVACSLPFVRYLALLLVHCLQIWLYFAFLGVLAGFWGVSCGFVLSWWFAWLVGLLYACGVRRLYDLWRVCLRFSSFAPVFASFCPLFFFALVVFACPLALSLLFLFPFRIYTQKEGALRVGASSLRVLWRVQILVQLSKNSFAVYLAFSSSSG